MGALSTSVSTSTSLLRSSPTPSRSPPARLPVASSAPRAVVAARAGVVTVVTVTVATVVVASRRAARAAVRRAARAAASAVAVVASKEPISSHHTSRLFEDITNMTQRHYVIPKNEHWKHIANCTVYDSLTLPSLL